MNTNTLSTRWTLSLLALAVCAGCTTGKTDSGKLSQAWDVRKAVGLKKEEELAPPQVPTRLVSTWQDATLNRPGEKSTRGFGGRILFFNDVSEDPIRVDGQLVIYAYDEQGREAHETHPTRRYVFPAEQFARHESTCKLGPSYSVWLPWDEIGGERKNISLIARFEPAGGALIAGDQTRHLLPGKPSLADADGSEQEKQVSDIQLTAYSRTSQITAPASATSHSAEPASDKARPEVTSISLSREQWEKRLSAAQSKQTLTSDSEVAKPQSESP